MLRRRLLVCKILGFLTLSPEARAADPAAPKMLPSEVETSKTDIGWAFTLRTVSDYNFFGTSYSNRKPATQAYAELNFFDNFLYAAGAVSSVALPNSASPPAEIDALIGFRPKWGDLTADIGVVSLFYLNERRFVYDDIIWTPASLNTVYAFSKFYYPIQDFVLGGVAYYSPNTGGGGVQSSYLAGQLRYNIPEKALGFLPAGLSISGELGRYKFWNRSDSLLFKGTKYPDYTYGNIGVSYAFDKFTFDLRVHGTNLTKEDCFLLTVDPSGIRNQTFKSDWCGTSVIAALQFDISSATGGIFAAESPAIPASQH